MSVVTSVVVVAIMVLDIQIQIIMAVLMTGYAGGSSGG